ncbi:hypothetical protein ABH897_002320 [Paenibacillus sp. RC73]|uniref:DUF6744 family protein n=1 Tax=Paenibacillus sp. RC73 TaxID=3156250 RepID=UPI003834F264
MGEGWTPKEIRLPDAFRRATSAKFRRQVADGIYENYLFREVASDKFSVQRNLVCETVDTRGKRLDYEGTAGTVVLDKKLVQVNVSHTTAMAEQLVQNAVIRFDVYKNNYGSNTLRTVMMNILKSMLPTPVRVAGGVYFIPQKFEDQLNAYTTFVRSLEKGEAEIIPLINTKDMKGMVTRKLSEHLQDTLEACEAGVVNQLKKGELKAILEDAKRVVEDYKHYESIVTGDLRDMESKCQLIRFKVAAALKNMAE